jgi:hypothetical protein
MKTSGVFMRLHLFAQLDFAESGVSLKSLIVRSSRLQRAKTEKYKNLREENINNMKHLQGGMTMKLKPCPFCGDENARLVIVDASEYRKETTEKQRDLYCIQCNNVQDCGCFLDCFLPENNAIEQWNKRF